ncbi:MAG: peptide deformylase [Candidatus Omnitrophota bacterium]
MNPLEIKKYPDDVLRRECSLVDRITEKERILFERMVLTMRYFSGIGLAAPQIGISRKLIVVDIDEGVIKLANPVVLKTKGLSWMDEKCLSVPDIVVNVERSEEIIVSGLNEKGHAVELRAKGLLARVLQHEIDHLNGTLIIDYLTFQGKVRRGKGGAR